MMKVWFKQEIIQSSKVKYYDKKYARRNIWIGKSMIEVED